MMHGSMNVNIKIRQLTKTYSHYEQCMYTHKQTLAHIRKYQVYYIYIKDMS